MSENKSYTYNFEDYYLRCEEKTVYIKGKSKKELSNTEFDVLRILIENRGKFIKSDDLMRQIYKIEETGKGEKNFYKKQAINNDINRKKDSIPTIIIHLRGLFADYGSDRVITTIHNKGYCFIAEVNKIADEEIDFPGLLKRLPPEPVQENNSAQASISEAADNSEAKIIQQDISNQDQNPEQKIPEADEKSETEEINEDISGQAPDISEDDENTKVDKKLFEKWLFGSGRKILSRLSICVFLSLVISLLLEFTFKPDTDFQEFGAGDFKDPQSLIIKLSDEQLKLNLDQQRRDLISSFLCDKDKKLKELVCKSKNSVQLSDDEFRNILKKDFNESLQQLSDEQKRNILQAAFNGSLKDPSLFSLFKKDALGEQTKRLREEQRLDDDFFMLNRSLLQDAYKDDIETEKINNEIRKNKNINWANPLAVSLQFFTIIFALGYAWIHYKQDDFSYLGDNKVDEEVKESLRKIRIYWLGLFSSWLLLYLFLFFYFAEGSFRFSEKLGISTKAYTLLVNFLATTFNYINTMLIVYGFTVLNKQGEKKEESTENIFKYLIILLWGGTLTAYVISFFISEQDKNVSISLDLFTGIVAGIFMALFIGRLQSKFFGTKPWLLIFLYSYVTLQPLYVYLTINDRSNLWVVLLINLYLVLKCLLFLYMAWLFESTRLAFYLVEIREKHKDIESNWNKWLKKLKHS